MEETPVKNIFVPPRVEVIIYMLLSIFTFGFINIGTIINRFSAEPLTPLVVSADDYLGTLGFLSEIPLVNTLVIVVFWSGVGLVAYTVAWVLINAVIEARNEIVVESEYVNKGSLWGRFREPLLKSVFLISLFSWITLNAKWLVPWLLKDFRATMVSGQGTQLLELLLPVAGLAANLAITMLLLRLARHTRELIEAGKHHPAS